MHVELRIFVAELAGAAGATLALVVLTAFLSIPWSLSRAPGDPAPHQPGIARHMT